LIAENGASSPTHSAVNNIDTRALKAGQLFVALTGPNFDGHDYVATALEQGAAGAIVSRLQADVKGAQLLVSDTRIALGKIGAFNIGTPKSLFRLPSVASVSPNSEQMAAIISRVDVLPLPLLSVAIPVNYSLYTAHGIYGQSFSY
jgi:hypothetical protein